MLECHVAIGVNISERKSGTERTKKRKKRELVFFPPPGGASFTLSRVYTLHRFCPSYDNTEYLYPGPKAAQTKVPQTGKAHTILQFCRAN